MRFTFKASSSRSPINGPVFQEAIATIAEKASPADSHFDLSVIESTDPEFNGAYLFLVPKEGNTEYKVGYHYIAPRSFILSYDALSKTKHIKAFLKEYMANMFLDATEGKLEQRSKLSKKKFGMHVQVAMVEQDAIISVIYF